MKNSENWQNWSDWDENLSIYVVFHGESIGKGPRVVRAQKRGVLGKKLMLKSLKTLFLREGGSEIGDLELV